MRVEHRSRGIYSDACDWWQCLVVEVMTSGRILDSVLKDWVECEVKDDSHVFVLSKWKGGVIINNDGEDYGAGA